MNNFAQYFEDRKFLEYFLKTCTVIGPGFLAIGYFMTDKFMQLDWLKLMATSALFGILFATPISAFTWILLNGPCWLILHKLKKLTNRKGGSEEEYLNTLKVVLSVGESETKEEKATWAKSSLGDRAKRLEQMAIGHKEAFPSVVASYWFYFLLLFFITAVYVAGSYLGEKGHTFRGLVELLSITFYLVLPLATAGLMLIIYARIISVIFNKKYVWPMCKLLGLFLLVLSFVIVLPFL